LSKDGEKLNKVFEVRKPQAKHLGLSLDAYTPAPSKPLITVT